MTELDAGEEPVVRLVLRGAAAAAPVCEGDACYVPGGPADSTVDLLGTGLPAVPGVPAWPAETGEAEPS